MKCPKCKTNDLLDRGIIISCEANDRTESGCNFIIWRTVLAKLGHQLSDGELKTLIKGGEIELHLVSLKYGSPFDCIGTLIEKDCRWSIHFEFNNEFCPRNELIPNHLTAPIFGEAE